MILAFETQIVPKLYFFAEFKSSAQYVESTTTSYLFQVNLSVLLCFEQKNIIQTLAKQLLWSSFHFPPVVSEIQPILEIIFDS